MMRVLLLTLVLGLSFAANFAKANPNSNPWMRTCRIDQGIFYGLTTAESQDGYLWMCFFDDSPIGAEEFFLFKTNQGESLAIEAYRNHSLQSGYNCESIGAETVSANNDSGKVYNICRFADASLMDSKVLQAGPGAPQNAKLDRALSATY